MKQEKGFIVRRCARCKSTKVVIDAGIITGQYHCERCGFTSPIVLEEDISSKCRAKGQRPSSSRKRRC